MSRSMCIETSPLSWTCGSSSTFTPTSMKLNCVLTSGLMPTPPMPGWKLPVAVGCRSPILSVALTPSTERNCGACRTLVLVSLSVACSSALGSVTAKSEPLMIVQIGKRNEPGVLLVPVVPVVPCPGVPVVPVSGRAGSGRAGRAVVPVVPWFVGGIRSDHLQARARREVDRDVQAGRGDAAVNCRVKTLLASITRMSTTTSARGLSRS